jgi:hypothetical protein
LATPNATSRLLHVVRHGSAALVAQSHSSYGQGVSLTGEHIDAFIKAWHADFKEALRPSEARTEIYRLLSFFEDIETRLLDLRRRDKVTEPKNEINPLREAWKKDSMR